IADNGKFRQVQRTAARPDDKVFRMPAHILAFLLKKTPARRQGEVLLSGLTFDGSLNRECPVV
ncbi:hypothetical protein, partial [Xenorhabdus bovienii]|uniref:hypothetical protein n=1 Tax=Xenorhabdus bovienii TaxID=40576 RepID=UPI0023B3447F